MFSDIKFFSIKFSLFKCFKKFKTKKRNIVYLCYINNLLKFESKKKKSKKKKYLYNKFLIHKIYYSR